MSEVSTGSAGADGRPKLVKLKTHVTIEDFGQLTDDQCKQAGLAEISPLEKHLSDVQ